MNAADSNSETIAWGPWLIGVSGAVLFLVGGVRFVLKHRFSSIDALYCCLAVVPAGLFLLVFSHVLQHAKLASMIPLFLGGIMIFSFPAIDVALGLALLGVVAGPALGEWKNKKGRPQSTGAHMVAGMRKARSVMRTIDFCDPLTRGWIHCQLSPKNGGGM